MAVFGGRSVPQMQEVLHPRAWEHPDVQEHTLQQKLSLGSPFPSFSGISPGGFRTNQLFVSPGFWEREIWQCWCRAAAVHCHPVSYSCRMAGTGRNTSWKPLGHLRSMQADVSCWLPLLQGHGATQQHSRCWNKLIFLCHAAAFGAVCKHLQENSASRSLALHRAGSWKEHTGAVLGNKPHTAAACSAWGQALPSPAASAGGASTDRLQAAPRHRPEGKHDVNLCRT